MVLKRSQDALAAKRDSAQLLARHITPRETKLARHRKDLQVRLTEAKTMLREVSDKIDRPLVLGEGRVRLTFFASGSDSDENINHDKI